MRDFSDPWEPEDIFDRQAAAEQRAKMDAAAERNRIEAERDAAETRKRKEHMDWFTLASAARRRLKDYEHAGVEPLELDANGSPTVTLSMLFWLGWTIESISGQNVLVRPQTSQQYQRKSRDDYGNEQGS
jgi:hypothetical protein